MLRRLHIRNFAPAEDLAIEFGPGLNAITGETGAGKSILVGALGLALGERADRGVIRAGAESCSVELLILLQGCGPLEAVSEELGLPKSETGELIIRRSISSSGVSRAFVNDTAVTAGALKRIGDVLVDMHGPHEHQSLFNPDMQIALLDAYGGAEALRGEYAEARAAVLAAERELAELAGTAPEEALRQLDELSQQAREIREAGVSEQDEQATSAEHLILANAQRILELAQQASDALSESEYSAFAMLVKARKALAELSALLPEAGGWAEEAAAVAGQIQELGRELSRRMDGIEADPGRLQAVEDRLALYSKLKRKYGGSITEVLAYAAELEKRIQDLSGRDEKIRRLQTELCAARGGMEERGLALRAARRKAAKRLAAGVAEELAELGFMRSEFTVAVAPSAPAATGMDSVEFMFAPNAGEPLKPVRMTASSGEISRLMLAVKGVLAEHDQVPVLVFDEIDVNLGGRIADAVGARLAALAAGRQVICITHLAQVARHAAHHFVVEKQEASGRVFTTARRLEGVEREKEIARMIGGAGRSETALAHARELLAGVSAAGSAAGGRRRRAAVGRGGRK